MFMVFIFLGDDQFGGAVDVHVELKNTNYKELLRKINKISRHREDLVAGACRAPLQVT
jgi:hypothetical protein